MVWVGRAEAVRSATKGFLTDWKGSAYWSAPGTHAVRCPHARAWKAGDDALGVQHRFAASNDTYEYAFFWRNRRVLASVQYQTVECEYGTMLLETHGRDLCSGCVLRYIMDL